MRLLVLGNNEITYELRNQGHRIIVDPGEPADAVICTTQTYRLAPDNVPLFVLLSGGLADWTARKERPDANFYPDAAELINELNAKVFEVKIEHLPVNQKESMITAVYANKGGVGKTTAAISIASLLAEQGAKTVLCDIDYGGANLASFYNINKRFTDYLKQPDTLNSALFKVQSNLFLLPAPTGIVPNQVSPQSIADTLNRLRGMFQVIVCDTCPSPWEKPYMHQVFSNADLVYAIINQSKFSVEEARVYGPQLLLMGSRPENIRIILNSYDPRFMSPRKVEEAFNQGFKKEVKHLPKISAIIPFDHEENMLALQKGNVINKDIWRQITSEVTGRLSGELTPDTNKGWLGNLGRRFKSR